MNFVMHGVSVGASRATRFGWTERSPFENRQRNLTSWLDSAMIEQVLLYCPSRKRAWLVPKISLILHLVIAHMKAIAEGAFRTLFDHLEDPLPEPDLEGDCRLKHLVTTYLYSLDNVSRHTRVPRFSQVSYGFEAADIIHQPKYFRLKTGNASNQIFQIGSLGGWTKLLEVVDVLPFIEGIQDPIVPHSTDVANGYGDSTCAELRRMPRQRKFDGSNNCESPMSLERRF
ncbi:uncharacterized protein A1O5_04619 [Cladophialophora psammophila CBS 110553]|uniref:Uncharacterized protein n=1 Tax=Cladophialophora psammophila CBS 110553 TaxID=1182543 RepID=W9X485_9EURO|nr:uncharacterized protein A1O5_04619 [Cladophialophora psammophila CBS 110553]EXJ72115.1 hypothetical protein A1O5_04619 [Cladophialophora psammophila CBS 110553]